MGDTNCTLWSVPTATELDGWKLRVSVAVTAVGNAPLRHKVMGGCDAEPTVKLTGAVPRALMVMVIVAVAVCLLASVTVKVTVDVPAVVGAPLIAPDDARLRPAGRLPPVRANVYGDVPPEAASVCENAEPTVPVRLPVVRVNCVPAAETTMEYCRCPDWPAESVAAAVNRNEPVAVGVPLMVPELAPNCKPPGRLPEAIDQV